jgi:hypothetical protein
VRCWCKKFGASFADRLRRRRPRTRIGRRDDESGRGDHVEVVSMRFAVQDAAPVADDRGLLGIQFDKADLLHCASRKDASLGWRRRKTRDTTRLFAPSAAIPGPLGV